MDREKILALIDVKRTRGLEIGALMRPVVTREMGPVEYIDRAGTEELRQWYGPNPEVDTSQIVEVDHVWGEQTLLECVGGHRVYDYVVTSHVIEHVPDLFGWLGEISAVLADGGIGSFVVPDKRYTFDVLRRTSSESELVDAYVRGLRRPDARQIFDHFMGFRDLGSEPIASGRMNPAQAPPSHDAHSLLELCQRVQASGEYIDTHCWVFTPATFVNTLDLASRLGVLPFEIGAFFPTPAMSHEFFVSLRRLPDAMSAEDKRAAFVASRERLALPAEHPSMAAPGELGSADTWVNWAAEMELRAMKASTSWRITAPLRKAVNFVRGRRDAA